MKIHLKKLLSENKSYKTLKLLESIENKFSSTVVKKSKKQIFEEVVRSLVKEISISDLRNKFVGDQLGQVSQEVFQSILDAAKDDRGRLNNAYVQWLATNIGKGYIEDFDIDQFGKYLEVFSRFKSSFPSPDILFYNTPEKISKFAEAARGKLESKLESDPKYINKNEIAELQSVGIDLLGMTENGYQVFKVDKEKTSGDRELAQKTFRKILGKCKGRSEGETISQCIFAAVDHFNHYLNSDDIYVFYNLSDGLSPYSFVYAKNEFKDKNNKTVDLYPEEDINELELRSVSRDSLKKLTDTGKVKDMSDKLTSKESLQSISDPVLNAQVSTINSTVNKNPKALFDLKQKIIKKIKKLNIDTKVKKSIVTDLENITHPPTFVKWYKQNVYDAI